MNNAPARPDQSAFNLSAMLFHEVSSLTVSPSDGVYADCLLSLAFSHLLSALAVEPLADNEAIPAVVKAIADCRWLSDTMRAHLSRTLGKAAAGEVSPRLACQVAVGARNRTVHAMVIDCMRAIGSDGLTDVADALALLTPKETAH